MAAAFLSVMAADGGAEEAVPKPEELNGTGGRPLGLAQAGMGGVDDGFPLGFCAANQFAAGMGMRGGVVCHIRAISGGVRP